LGENPPAFGRGTALKLFHTFFKRSSQLLHTYTVSLSQIETVNLIKGVNNMKKIWIIGILVIAAALTAGAALAQAPTPVEPGAGYGPGTMSGRGGYGMMGQGFFQAQPADGNYGPMHESMVEAFANALGASVEDIESRLAAGESMWQVAEAFGISPENFSALRAEVRAGALQKAVEAGLITQEQATWMNQRMGSRGFAGGACNGTGPDGTDRPSSGMRGFGNRGARAASQGG
jgi:hypothetical protein